MTEMQKVGWFAMVSSPTLSLDASLFTVTVDTKRQGAMTADTPNAFIQTTSPKDGERVVMKIT